MLDWSGFFGRMLDECQAFWRLLGSLGLHRDRFKISGGAKGTPKDVLCRPKGVLEGSFEGPKGINVRNGRQQGILKIVQKRLFFLLF